MQTPLTDEQKNILQILSRGNQRQYQELLRMKPIFIHRSIKGYYSRKPVVDDLKEHHINVNLLSDMLDKTFSEELYIKAIPILVKWLQKTDLPYIVKASIIKVLIDRPVSKSFAFDTIINEFKKADLNYLDEDGFQTDFPMVLGNAFLRWTDDAHAETILELVSDEKNNEENLLLASLANFKKPENKQKAIDFLLKQLQRSDNDNFRVGSIISTLRKLHAIEAKKYIEPFITYPKNYRKGSPLRGEDIHFDGEVRREAKKAINAFDKLLLSKRN